MGDEVNITRADICCQNSFIASQFILDRPGAQINLSSRNPCQLNRQASVLATPLARPRVSEIYDSYKYQVIEIYDSSMPSK